MIPASDHAVRRYCERRLGVLVEAISDAEAIRILRRVGCDVDTIRSRISDAATRAVLVAEAGGLPIPTGVKAMGVRFIVRDGIVVTTLTNLMYHPALL